MTRFEMALVGIIEGIVAVLASRLWFTPYWLSIRDPFLHVALGIMLTMWDLASMWIFIDGVQYITRAYRRFNRIIKRRQRMLDRLMNETSK